MPPSRAAVTASGAASSPDCGSTEDPVLALPPSASPAAATEPAAAAEPAAARFPDSPEPAPEASLPAEEPAEATWLPVVEGPEPLRVPPQATTSDATQSNHGSRRSKCMSSPVFGSPDDRRDILSCDPHKGTSRPYRSSKSERWGEDACIPLYHRDIIFLANSRRVSQVSSGRAHAAV